MDREYKLTLRQDEAYEYLTNDKDLSVLYGGAKGGGKSFLLCIWAYLWARWLIDFFCLKEQLEHPLPVGFIGRKRGVDFEKTTFETWKEIIPARSYENKIQDKEIIIEKRVKILYGGLDDQEVINKFNSAEFAFIGIDQAEETERSELSVLQGALRRKHNNKQPPYKKFYTANPAECWLKEDFINNPRQNHHYIPALPTDNPHLPNNYMQTLSEAFSYDPVLLAAYKDGNWDLLQSHSTLITQTMLDQLKSVEFLDLHDLRIVANDPAIGGDECVFYCMEDGEVIDTLILHINDTQKIGAEAVAFMTKHSCRNYIGDGIGIGKGVVDYVRNCGMNVIEFISSEAADDPEHFSNRRAEIWHFVTLKIQRREVPYPQDEKLRRQLCAVEHKNGTRRFELVRKDITKKKLGESPDRADAWVMGVWGTAQINDTEGYGIESYRVRPRKAVFAGAAGY